MIKKVLCQEANYKDFKEIYLTIHPSNNTADFKEQTINCFEQLKDFFEKNNLNTNNLFNIVCSLRVKNEHEYDEKCNIFGKAINLFFESNTRHIVGYTAQAPYESQLALEITLIDIKKKDTEYIQKETTVQFNNKNYIVGYSMIENKDLKELNIAGVQVKERLNDTFFQADGAYYLLNEILKKEKMTIQNIVCQRNTISNVVELIEKDDKILQRYQIYNEKRGENYGRDSDWKHGYPASTGIGTVAGGVSIRGNALKNKSENIKIYSISNRNQINPYWYSKRVLIGDNAKTSPQWERAKAIVFQEKDVRIYISGTASLRGEDVVASGNIIAQTKITLENIEFLISKENLNNAGIHIKKQVNFNDFKIIKIYVKFEKDIQNVISICNEKLPANLPRVYVVADVCRPDWLVEIEGIVKTEMD